MNHSSNVASITQQVNESSLLAKYNLPFILGETNSLFDAGKPGLSNTFGAVSTSVFNVICKSDIHVPFPEIHLPTIELSWCEPPNQQH
jgi:hypothetical protein